MLEVTWHPPQFLGTTDTLLLRYTVLYSPGKVLNENSTMRTITPQLSSRNEVTVRLSNLTKGHEYAIGVVATSTSIIPLYVPTLITLASTYGEGEFILMSLIFYMFGGN